MATSASSTTRRGDSIEQMKKASKGEYDEQHVLKRAVFIEDKLLQFPEAESTKKRFV
jgi:hypothetical protein